MQSILKPQTKQLEYIANTSKKIEYNGIAVLELNYYNGHPTSAYNFYSENNQLVVFLKGTMQIKYGKTEIEAKENQVALIKNRTQINGSIQLGEQKEANHEFLVLRLSDDIIVEFLKMTELSSQLELSTSAIYLSEPNMNISKFINYLKEYMHDSIKMDKLLIKIKLLEFLLNINSNEKMIIQQLMNYKKENRPTITSVMEQNIMNSISLDQLAKMAGRSLSSFRRDFLSTYNMPPSQWIRERRLEKAVELLTNTRMSISDICYTLGFENIAHFSRIFKSKYGKSPSNFREILLNNSNIQNDLAYP